MKHCNECQKDLPEISFSKNPNNKDGLNHCCKSCLEAAQPEKLPRIYEGVLAIDPSIRACGIAIFDKNKLIHCDVVRTKTSIKPMDAIEEITNRIQLAWEAQMGVLQNKEHNRFGYFPEVLVIETPVVRGPRFMKGDPNDLMYMAILAGKLWERFDGKAIYLPHPEAWKGQRDKKVVTKSVKSELSKQENFILEDDLQRTPEYLRHNGYEAAGLGLWSLKKLGRRNDSPRRFNKILPE